MVPPSILVNQSAESVLAAVEQKCSAFMWPAPGTLRAAVLVLVSDSHKALVRLSMHFANACNAALPAGDVPVQEAHMFVHCRCMMHLGFASVTTMLRAMEIINGTYCATLLLRKGQSQTKLKQKVRLLIRERVQFAYHPPNETTLAANRSLLKMLDKVDEELDEQPVSQLVKRQRSVRASACSA